MKNYIFKYDVENENGEKQEKEIRLRLKSSDSIEIEKSRNARLLDIVQDYSITNIIMLLQYMRSGTGEVCTKNMAMDMYDELVDNGYTLEKILFEVLYPTLVVSGILSQEDLDGIIENKEKTKNMSDEEKIKLVQERKNLMK